jgi:ribosomal protein S4E
MDRIEAKGAVYQVVSVDRTESGYNVRLRSAKRVSTTPISKNNASRKFWHVI